MSRQLPCPRCGQELGKYRGLCKECFLKSISLRARSGGLPRISFCTRCGSVTFGGDWIQSDLWEPKEEAFPAIIEAILHEDTFIGHVVLAINDLTVEGVPPGRPKRYHGSYHISLEYDPGEVIEFDEPYEVAFKWVSCPSCSRVASGAFDAKIQLRGKRLDETEVWGWLNEAFPSTDDIGDDFPVVAMESDKDGFDVRFRDRSSANIAIAAFRDRGALIKSTYESAGWDKLRQQPRRRIVFSVRFWHYPRGTLLLVRGSPIQLLSVPSKRVAVHDYGSGKTEGRGLDDLWDAFEHKEIVALTKDDSSWRDFQLSSIEPDGVTALIMNLRSFETFYEDLLHIPKRLEVGDTFRGLFWDERLLADFCLPFSPFF